ncbi:MAG TPA: 50S ribosomal protein L21 [Burkholderiales bacterium]|jgi:large subunit ribosomal protein L21|nr:50S ribosomal protein L21 [Burkholderiales bacterium]
MYAVIAAGGRQYRVAPGDVIRIDRIDADAGSEIAFDQLLMIGGEGEEVAVGAPHVAGKVTAKVRGEGRHDKIEIVKMRRRKNYRRHGGHRQHYTEIEITGIERG